MAFLLCSRVFNGRTPRRSRSSSAMRYLAEPGSHECRKWGTGARASWRAVYGDTAYSVTVFLIPYASGEGRLDSSVACVTKRGRGVRARSILDSHTALSPPVECADFGPRCRRSGPLTSILHFIYIRYKHAYDHSGFFDPSPDNGQWTGQRSPPAGATRHSTHGRFICHRFPPSCARRSPRPSPFEQAPWSRQAPWQMGSCPRSNHVCAAAARPRQARHHQMDWTLVWTPQRAAAAGRAAAGRAGHHQRGFVWTPRASSYAAPGPQPAPRLQKGWRPQPAPRHQKGWQQRKVPGFQRGWRLQPEERDRRLRQDAAPVQATRRRQSQRAPRRHPPRNAPEPAACSWSLRYQTGWQLVAGLAWWASRRRHRRRGLWPS